MGLTENTATTLLVLNSLDVRPNSAVCVEGTEAGLVGSSQRVAILAPSGSQVPSNFEGECSVAGGEWRMQVSKPWTLEPDRLFDPNPARRSLARELAPLAGHYPALLLGAPWWFFDSPLGMRRYLDAVMETAGLYNTAGFNDDTRAFASIPSRHDVWRRISCDWLAWMVLTGVVDEEEATNMAREFAYGLANRAYGFQREPVGRA